LPNGDAEFHAQKRPELDRFFAPIADILTAFARQHNLKLERYYHQAPSWSFTFRHPRGGVGKIEVCREDACKVSVLCGWWYDEYDTLTRFSRSLKSQHLDLDPQVLSSEMEKYVRIVLSWQFGTWDERVGGNDSWLKSWSKQQFEALLDGYPIIRI
jgi:hypothetical protein